MKRPSAQRMNDVSAALTRLPVAPGLVDEAFAEFLATGLLPNESGFAAEVVGRLDQKHESPADQDISLYEWGRRLWAQHADDAPARDEVRDALLREAVWETGLARLAARSMLEGLVAAGIDLTQPIFDGEALPEFGTVGLRMLGFPERFVGSEHTEQAARLEARLDVLAKAIPHHDRSWWRSMHMATQLFQDLGERPDDPLVFECVLALGELHTLVELVAGRDVAEELAAFDAVFVSVGAEREAAVERLQAMAAAGQFRREDA